MKLREIMFGIIFAVLISIPIILNVFGDWLWFLSLKYESIFITILSTSIILGILTGVCFFIFSMFNIKLAKRRSVKKADKKRTNTDTFFIILSGFFALIIGLSFSNWDVLLKFLNRSAFNIVDPVFGLDLGFYVFELPFYSFLFNFFILTLILTTGFTLCAYVFYSSPIKRMTEDDIDESINIPVYTFRLSDIKKKLTPHISLLFGALFFVIAYGFVLAEYTLLFSGDGVVYGAGFTDLNVNLPLLMFLSILSVVIGFVFLLNLKIRRWKLIIKTIMIFASILFIGFLAANLVQVFIVAPNEFNLERPYIKRNIDHTLNAYNLNRMEEKIFPVSYNLTMDDITKNNLTIKNIRLWDWRPLIKTYNQLQLFRTYYNFKDVDIDRYRLDGKYKQVMISARELDTESLPARGKTWVNKHLVYTHGYGVVMNPVDKVSQEGLPEFYIKDIPPQSKFIKLERPEIYFGEENTDYAIIKTTTSEFDYPSGDKNIYTSYNGTAGVQLSFFNRLVYALKFGSIELLVSGSLKPESRILMYRNIDERVRRIAPFLSYDHDPYIVISDGKLYWIIDAYTTTDMYPYSEPVYFEGSGVFNYIRNSVKVVIDAFNGDVKYYVIDNQDPVIKTYKKIFPDIFLDFSDMPEDLKGHIRYPQDLFRVQAELYSLYHMKDPMVFYNKEDLWVIPDEIYRGTRQEMLPYYIIMKLPDKEKEEFILMIPFTPKGKENMIGWMAAKSDFPDYGDLMVFMFSKQELIYGPMQIEARIDQDTEISQKITLWSQIGSSVIRGNLLVIPIENSILYIEPLYLEAVEKGTLPELKRVILAYGNELTMQENLENALNTIFGAAPIPQPQPKTDKTEEQTPIQILSQLSDLYKKAQQSLREGNLTLYAEHIENMGKLLSGYSK